MMKLLGKLGAIVAVLAGIANILTYVEQSQRFPEMIAMLRAIISLDALRLCANLGLVAAVLIVLWRQSRLSTLLAARISMQEAHARTKESPLSLKANQIVYPAENGVVWEWNEKEGAAGPFCPTHGIPLVYKNYMRHVQPAFTDEDFLGGTGRFSCLTDDAEFVFYEPPTLRVGELRLQAVTMLCAALSSRYR